MVTLIASQIQDRLRDGSCLLTSGPQTPVPAALVSGPQSAAALAINKTALVSGSKTTALLSGSKTTAATAINKTALTSGTAALKTGTGAGAALGAGTIAGTILGILVVGLVAYGVNKAVRVYIK